MLFSTLSAYLTLAKTIAQFTPFQLIYGVEVVLPIECKIPSLMFSIEHFSNTSAEEECLLYLAHLDEYFQDALLVNETNKKFVKENYDLSILPWTFSKDDLVMVYDQDHDNYGEGKLVPLWHGPYIVKCALYKGTYELVYYDRNII